jgi:hypothetical protein
MGFPRHLCLPATPQARQSRVSHIPQQCYTSGLSDVYAEMMCDFEAHDYCTLGDCTYWINIVKAFSKHNSAPDLETYDPELSLKLIHFALELLMPTIHIGLSKLSLDAQHGSVSDAEEHRIMDHVLRLAIILLWYCDESQSRMLMSLNWTATLDYTTAILVDLQRYSLSTRCMLKSGGATFSSRCSDIQKTLSIFEDFTREFARRVVENTSQCPSDQKLHEADEL